MFKIPKYNTIGKKEINAVTRILAKGEISSFVASPNSSFYGGKWVKKFEKLFCKKFNIKYAISVNSATSALYCALMSQKLEPGDEVITSPYTMHATASSILQCNAIPIFADIESKTFGLDPLSVEKKITKKTKGILAVNIFGHTCELKELKKIAKKNNLFLIEDNSQGPGAKDKYGNFAGTIGDASIISLNRHKTIQCGEGGVILTNNKKIRDNCCLVRNHGEAVVRKFKTKDIRNTIGQNLRLTEVQSAIGYYQLKKLDKLNKERIKRAEILNKMFENIDCIETPFKYPNSKHVYYFYVMKLDETKSKISRKDLVKKITRLGYNLRAGYVDPLYKEPIFQKQICFGSKGFPFSLNKNLKKDYYKKNICPNCENINSKVLISNMLHPEISEKDLKNFAKKIIKLVS
jgi:perosamine synthetase